MSLGRQTVYETITVFLRILVFHRLQLLPVTFGQALLLFLCIALQLSGSFSLDVKTIFKCSTKYLEDRHTKKNELLSYILRKGESVEARLGILRLVACVNS